MNARLMAPSTMRGIFFFKWNSFFLKFQAKNKFKKVRNWRNLLMKKQSISVIKPKLLTVMTRTQKPKRYNSWQRKGWLPYPKQKNFSTGTLLIVQQQVLHASCVKSRHMYTRVDLIQATCTSENLKNKRTSNQDQE